MVLLLGVFSSSVFIWSCSLCFFLLSRNDGGGVYTRRMMMIHIAENLFQTNWDVLVESCKNKALPVSLFSVI